MTDEGSRDGTIGTSREWALHLSADSEIECNRLDTARLARGFTIQAWVRPAANHRGVTAFGGDRFQGAAVEFDPGRYDDLTRFRLTAADTDTGQVHVTLASLCIPSGFRATLFAETGCNGDARSFDDDVPDLGDWNHKAKSLLVIDAMRRAQEHVVVYSEPHFGGRAMALDMRRYEDLSALPIGAGTISSLSIPPGLEVTLYAKRGCMGASIAAQGEVDDLGRGNFDNKALSLAVSRAPHKFNDRVTFHEGDNFTGSATDVESGGNPETEEVARTLGHSVRIPPGMRVTSFDESRWMGRATTWSGGQSSLPDDWSARSRSMLIARVLGRYGGGVHVFGDRKGAWDLPLGRYDDLAEIGAFRVLRVPASYEVTLYAQEGCQGNSEVFSSGCVDIGAWEGCVKSLVVARRSRVFGNPAGVGLWLTVQPGRIGMRPPETCFAGHEIRAERWSHIAATWAYRHWTCYLNGRAVTPKGSSPGQVHGTAQPDLSGFWRLGAGFRGEIRHVSVLAGALDERALALGRFTAPDPHNRALVAAWRLDAEQGEVDELVLGHSRALPERGAFWVATKPPRSPLESAVGKHALAAVRRHAHEQLKEQREAGHARMVKAHDDRKATLEAAHARAATASFDSIHYVSGGRYRRVDSKGRPTELAGHSNPVSSIAVFPDGRWAVSASEDRGIGEGHEVRLWDLDRGECVHVVDAYRGLPRGLVAWEGSWLTATTTGDVQVWDLQKRTGVPRQDGSGATTVGIFANTLQNVGNRRRAVWWSWPGKIVALDVAAGPVTTLIADGVTDVTAVAVDPSGRCIVVGEAHGWIQVRDGQTGRLLRRFPHDEGLYIATVAVSADGRRALSATGRRSGGVDGESTSLKLWNLETGACLHTLTGHSKLVLCIAFHPNGRHALTGAADSTVRIWDLETGACIRTMMGHGGPDSPVWVTHIALSGDARRALSSGNDGTLRIWYLDLEQGRPNVLGPSDTRLAIWNGRGYRRESHSDVALDPVARTAYLAQSFPEYRVLLPGFDNYYERHTPVHALALDPAHDKRHLYWIEGSGALVRGGMDSTGASGLERLSTPVVLEVLDPGREEWSLVVDSERARIFWSNGRDIRGCSLAEPGKLGPERVVVPRGVSPHPIALTCDHKTGDLFWLDLELQRLRTAGWDGVNVRDLYETPGLRNALAVDAPSRRVFWSAEHRDETGERRACLFSGSLDGSLPAVPLFPLVADAGLRLLGAAAAAEEKLMLAQHDFEVAQRAAADQLKREREIAHERLTTAHESRDRDHAAAEQKLATAHADASRMRKDAYDRKMQAGERAERQKAEANTRARQQCADAELQAKAITDAAYQKAGDIKEAASRELGDARRSLSTAKEDLEKRS